MVPFELRFISVIQNGRGILSFEHTFRGLSASAFESLVNFFQTLPVSFQPSAAFFTSQKQLENQEIIGT
jgi:hypothetical protein